MIPGIVAGQMSGAAPIAPPAQTLTFSTSSTAHITLTESLRRIDVVTNPNTWAKANIIAPKSAGKWYFEVEQIGTPPSGGTGVAIGIAVAGTATTTSAHAGTNGRIQYFGTGRSRKDATYVNYGAEFGDGDRIGIALDADANTLTAYKNGVSQGVMYTGLTENYEPHFCFYYGPVSLRLTSTALYLPSGYTVWG